MNVHSICDSAKDKKFFPDAFNHETISNIKSLRELIESIDIIKKQWAFNSRISEK